MDEKKTSIDSAYTRYYSDRKHQKVYPTEFVVRILLAKYPGLCFKKPQPGDSILDVGFGDGRNTVFLCDLGLDVYGIEITLDIVAQTRERLGEGGYHPELKVGRNSAIPYPDEHFDYILACHCCYYCDEGETLLNNLAEYHRTLKKNGVLIASIADSKSYIFDKATELPDGTWRINDDPYENRIGYRLQAFSDPAAIETYCSSLFNNFSFGKAENNYFGVDERVFWVVCKKVQKESE